MASSSPILAENETVALYSNGTGLHLIAKKFKCHTRRIVRILDKYNIKRRRGFQGKHSDETKLKISQSGTGKKRSILFCKNNSEIKRGRILLDETREKISLSRIGRFLQAENPNWRGGVTNENEKIRKSDKYKQWRSLTYKRDNYTCCLCGQQGGELHADHIKPFAIYPDLRLDLDNGRTLCRNCHQNTPTYGGRLQKGEHYDSDNDS